MRSQVPPPKKTARRGGTGATQDHENLTGILGGVRRGGSRGDQYSLGATACQHLFISLTPPTAHTLHTEDFSALADGETMLTAQGVRWRSLGLIAPS